MPLSHIAPQAMLLRRFTERLQASLRQSIDWVACYGGEEFVLVLPEASLEAAQHVAEKVRGDCAGAPMKLFLSSVPSPRALALPLYLPLPRVCRGARMRCCVRPRRLFIVANKPEGIG